MRSKKLKFFPSVFTHEPPGEWKIPELDITHPIKDLEITEQLVKEQFDSIKTSKYPGLDEIHPKFLFELRYFLTQVLTKTFNKSWDETKLPEEWKLAHIASIIKKGKKSSADNYRPVSLTSTVCKIFEKIIRAHCMEHLEKNEILVNELFGFLPGRSSQTQLLRVLDDFTKIIDSRRETDVIYLDFKKAFDSVPHKRLIGILKHYGIKGKTLG